MMSSCNIPLFLSVFFFIHISLCIEGCIESERVALLEFKNGLTDPSNRLADWVPHSSDCCNWSGVVCHNLTSHVLELHLRTLSLEEYFSQDISDNEYSEYDENYRKSALGGKVSSFLLHLKHLSYLDLSSNEFGGVTIPKFIGSVWSLRYLNLSHSRFGGIIPPQLGNLSNLNYLHLQSFFLKVENLGWVSSLSSLEFLDLSDVDLSQSFDWLKVMNSVPSLVELHLSSCFLPGFSPSSLPNLNFSSLEVLDLSQNYFGCPIPNGLQNMSSFIRELDLSGDYFNSSIPDWLYDLTHLQLLNLNGNQFQGQVSSRIGNLTSLISLELRGIYGLEFEKGIPISFQNLCNLRSLILSEVKINQEINDVLSIMSRCVSSVLQVLDLSSCQLSGHLTDDLNHFKNLVTSDISKSSISGPIPLSFGSLKNLEYVDVSSNSISGPIPISFGSLKKLGYVDVSSNSISGPIPLSFGSLKELEYVDISNNSISGPIPLSFGSLKKLEYVDISENDLEGEVSQLHFANLTRLKVFTAYGMKNNKLTLRVSSNWIPPLQLERLALSSWKIGSQFPMWLRLLKNLDALDLSDSDISAPVPIWFWNLLPNFSYLNFAHNHMHGSIPNNAFSKGAIPAIDLSSNNFSGEVPYFSSNVSQLDLSHNSFLGSVSNFLCYKRNEVKAMSFLNLEGNLLSGEIPDCWGSWGYLAVVKLSNNSFGGNIHNSIGTLSDLESLHLRNNNLSGELPSSIQNCSQLVSLDISENHLGGKIPKWIGSGFSNLIMLNLHGNNFDGNLPEELCNLVSLKILDLSHNNISGIIPSCFSNFTGMANRIDATSPFILITHIGGFMESALLLMKGKVMEYNTNLIYVRSIDLSDNNLSGEIPGEIANLTELVAFNLSRNVLTGRIPNNIGNMKGLEAIDFSHNILSGEIPQSMATLTFLGTLDLSYNNLSGRIPSGTQLQSFNSSSFVGNRLCGLPLTFNCTSNNVPPNTHIEEDDDNEVEVDVWFYESMAYGFAFGFWIVVGVGFLRVWFNRLKMEIDMFAEKFSYGV